MSLLRLTAGGGHRRAWTCARGVGYGVCRETFRKIWAEEGLRVLPRKKRKRLTGGNHRGRQRRGKGKTQTLVNHLGKTRLYDIRNAGPHHRYTVSGKLVHDEVICDQPLSQGSVEEACCIMSKPPAWAAGLPLSAEGFECGFYKKD